MLGLKAVIRSILSCLGIRWDDKGNLFIFSCIDIREECDDEEN
jgi:hypothetical protein